jgi:hypothetical protein
MRAVRAAAYGRAVGVPGWAKVLGPAAVVVAVVLWIAGAFDDGDGGGAKPAPAAVRASSFLLARGEGPPREIVYLDPARVEAYLSQFQGGQATLERTSAADTDKRTVGVDVATAKLSREVQAQDTFERQVTPTNSSRLVALEGYLKAAKGIDLLEGLPVHRRDEAKTRAFLRGWHAVHEGTFVRIGGQVRMPAFMRLYQTIRQVGAGSPIGRRGAEYVRIAGRDPSFPLTVTVPSPDGGDPLRIVMPAKFSALATESSLFYGRLKVLGKVIYRVNRGGRAYTDKSITDRFLPGLTPQKMPADLLARLGLGRRELADEVRSFARIDAPAAIVLPIAIYK